MSANNEMRFVDRRDAGRRLAERLRGVVAAPDALVLGLPRGGVVVADEVARALALPLDVAVVRKLGVPGHEELAMGAVASGGSEVRNREIIASLGIDAATVAAVAARERAELSRRERLFRGDAPPPRVTGRDVVLVDDGLATGATMSAAVAALRQQRPRRLLVAVPVASSDAVVALRRDADQVIALATPDPFYGVGAWYDDFRQTADAEVQQILAGARGRASGQPPGGAPR